MAAACNTLVDRDLNRHASFVSANSAINIFKWDVMSSFPSKLLKHMVETFPPLLESGLSIGKSSRVLQQITSRLKVLLPMLPLQMLLFETPPGCLLHVGLNGAFTPRTFPPKIDRRFGKNWKAFERMAQTKRLRRCLCRTSPASSPRMTLMLLGSMMLSGFSSICRAGTRPRRKPQQGIIGAPCCTAVLFPERFWESFLLVPIMPKKEL